MCFHQAQIRHLSTSNSHWGYNSVLVSWPQALSPTPITTQNELTAVMQRETEVLRASTGGHHSLDFQKLGHQRWKKQRNKKDQRLISQRKAYDSWAQRPENNCMESVLSFILLQFWRMNSHGQLYPARAMEPSSPANMISELLSHWSGTLWVGETPWPVFPALRLSVIVPDFKDSGARTQVLSMPELSLQLTLPLVKCIYY